MCSSVSTAATVHASSRAAEVRRAARVLAILVAASIPALVLADVVGSVSEQPPMPTLATSHLASRAMAREMTLAVLAIVSAFALVLAPGLVAMLALGGARDVGQWLLRGLALSLVGVSATTAAVQAALGRPLLGTGFVLVVAGCALFATAVLAWRIGTRRPVRWPTDAPGSLRTLTMMVALPTLLLFAMAPKFFWESFNGDGVHAFESSRLLLHHVLPFWGTDSGDPASFPGVTTLLFAYPNAWLIRLFGPWEVTARAPLLLFLPALFGALVAVAQVGLERAVAPAERRLMWAVLVVYTVAVSYNATYSHYSADIAMPGTRETLLMVCVLGFIHAFLTGERVWLALFAALSYFTLPSGLLLMVGWCVAAFLLLQPRPVPMLRAAAVSLAACMVVGTALPFVLAWAGAPAPGQEFQTFGLLRRFWRPNFLDVGRLLYAVIPGGIVPAMLLFAVRRQDRVARALTLLTVGYLLFFYVQRRAPLHYYVPAMLLPLVVMARTMPAIQHRTWVRRVAAVGVVVALWLSVPADSAVPTFPHQIGRALEIRSDGYGTLSRPLIRASSVLQHLFPYDWDPTVPHAALGGSPLAWLHYGQRAKPPGTTINYLLQHAEVATPTGYRALATADGFTVLVRDDSVWAAHRALRPSTTTGSPILLRSRRGLF